LGVLVGAFVGAGASIVGDSAVAALCVSAGVVGGASAADVVSAAAAMVVGAVVATGVVVVACGAAAGRDSIIQTTRAITPTTSSGTKPPLRRGVERLTLCSFAAAILDGARKFSDL
jgi:hypothetical protein